MGVLNGRHIILGVTGSVAAYKSCELARIFIKAGAKVRIVMSAHAAELVRPLLFETLTGNRVCIDMFPEERDDTMKHIGLADWADIFLVAPATANFIGKAASGIADDLISTTYLTVDAPVIIAPAMNTRMWNDKSVAANVIDLKSKGVIFVGPGSGELACGTSGEGRLIELDRIFDSVVEILARPGPLSGRKILVTAGPTREFIDDVRFLSNPSTGRMGFALAEAAASKGADVTLIFGPTQLEPPEVVRAISVISTAEMAEAVRREAVDSDIIFMAAAVADWTIEKNSGKIKKSGRESLHIDFHPTGDILAGLGEGKGRKLLVGFAVETENIVGNARAKLEHKNLDLIFANDPGIPNTTFAAKTNAGYLLSRGAEEIIPLMEKDELAGIILNRAIELLREKQIDTE